jgi:hypothetical protein
MNEQQLTVEQTVRLEVLKVLAKNGQWHAVTYEAQWKILDRYVEYVLRGNN